MKRLSLLPTLLCSILLAPVPAWSQAQVSSGDIKGAVKDATDLPVAGARITVTNPDLGTTRTVMTDDAGGFRVALLEPGTYRVRVEAEGFTTKVTDKVVVRVGDTVVLNTALDVGQVSTEITVLAEAPVIEPERTQQSTTLEHQRIENLPINRRNYLDFALLAPGVVETNTLVDDNDYRVAQAPQSGISFGGSNGRGNAFTIDGLVNYYNSGGVRPSVSQEAVQEFQINRNSFTSEFGGSMGGAVNIVTKSGTNEVHGNLFGFLRHRDIQARNFFDPGKSAFTRGQYGATFGAPIRRDHTFFFGSFERLDRHETAFVPILQDRTAFGMLTSSQEALAVAFEQSGVPSLQALAAGMRRYLITTNFPDTVAMFNQNSGNFPFAESTTQGSVRLDHHSGEKNHLFLRANLTDGNSQNAQFGALIAFNRGRGLDSFDGTFAAGFTHVFSPRWVSSTRAMFAYNKLAVLPTDPIGPDLTITGYGAFGREIFLPATSFERHYQILQSFDFTSGGHSLKFGGDVNPVKDVVRSETFFGGRFSFGEQVPFGALLPTFTGDPNAAAAVAAALVAIGKPNLVPNLAQPITSVQAFNLGLPTLYQQGFGDPNWAVWFTRVGLFAQDAWKPVPTLTLNIGVRYDYEGPPVPLTTQHHAAPRIGFAWMPSRNGKTVIRGGYGLYYGPFNAQIANLPATLDGKQIAQAAITAVPIPGLINPITGRPLTSFDVYQTLKAQGVIGKRTITREDIAQFGLNPGPNSFGRVIFGITPDYTSPWAQQASFQIERAFGSYAVSAGYEFNRGAHIPRNLDRNLFYTGRTALNQPTFGFRDPTLLQYNVMESTANSFYHALIVQAARRFSRHFSLNAHYTFCKAIDEVTDFNSDFQPHDQLNPKAERALSSFDQRHRFVFSAVAESPWTGSLNRTTRAILGGFTAAPVVMASSGRPFNLLAGYDNFGDRHPTTHRPFGAGRNIGRGPDMVSIDLRIGRRFMFGEGRSLEFIAEGFNLQNRSNFRSVNNTVGNVRLGELPNPIQGHVGVVTTPLAYTSAFDARQFQFGLKINY
jgi:hypothetical protein